MQSIFKSLRANFYSFLRGSSFEFYTKKEIRHFFKGYNQLKKNSNLNLIQNLNSDLISTPLTKYTFEEALKIPEEICLIQFLKYRKLNIDFTKSILISEYRKNNKISFGLPYEWRKKLKEKGYKFSVKSILNWELYKFLWLLVGLFYGLKKIFQFFYFERFPKEPYAHLFGINTINHSDKKKYQFFIDWLKNQMEMSTIKTLTLKSREAKNSSQDKFRYVNHELPGIERFSDLLIFTFWLLKIFFLGLIKFDSHNIIFIEKINRKLVSMASKKSLAKIYFFNNQYAQIRPLWTYENITKDFKVILFFYSTNNFSLKFKKKKFNQQFNWELSNWPIYWVWDNVQTSFLAQNCKHIFQTYIKGPIPNFKNHYKSFENNFISLIIFDVQPHRESYYSLLGIDNEYYSFDNSKVFFEDIIEISTDLKIKVFFKRKRESKFTSKPYLFFLNKLKNSNNNFNEIDPNESPFKILKNNNLLISINMPYTSTATLSHFFKLPTVYYDPKNILDTKFNARGEINMIQTKQELKNWVIEQISILNSKMVI